MRLGVDMLKKTHKTNETGHALNTIGLLSFEPFAGLFQLFGKIHIHFGYMVDVFMLFLLEEDDLALVQLFPWHGFND
jgi:hypothetical protein